MTSTSPSPPGSALPANHHADHPGFAGASGLLFALFFAVGRTGSADLAIALTGAGPGDDVVDIGCGAGVAVRRAAARGATSVVGVDPAPVMRRVARALTTHGRGSGRAVSYRDGTAEALPLPDGSATVAWSLATVHHWRDVETGLAEAHRVLGPGGRFLALERSTHPGASGVASHGWTREQAHLFAEQCRAAGFTAEVGDHQVGRRPLLSVLSRAA
jgi:ubiquinone/menaquinone biosynthesis C-methylase UbiE